MKGLRVVENKNGIVVAWVHYSADPDKDPETPAGREWIKTAKSGVTKSDWAKEMEIDFGAKRGTLVYEEWRPEIHLVEPYAIPTTWTRYMSIDPGMANPTAIIWLAVRPDGDYVVYEEYYFKERTVPEHASAIRSIEAFDKIQWRVMDAAGWNRDPATKQQLYIESWAKEGMHFKPGSKDEEAGIQEVKMLLKFVPELGIVPHNPRLTVFNTCRHFIWEIEKWRYPEQSMLVMERKNPIEKGIDKDNHLMDALRILVQYKPRYIKPGNSMRPVILSK